MTSAKENRYSFLLPRSGSTSPERASERRRDAENLGHLLAQVVVSELPEIATITRTIRDREGRVYVDFLQNRRGQLLVAPFSVRPVPEAAVSTPLRWSEVTQRLDIRKHTIRTVPARMRRLKGGDPFLGVLKDRPDLIGALGRLARRSG